MMCWKRYASKGPHFAQIIDVIASFLEHVNNKRNSFYSDNDDEDLEEVLQRRNSRLSGTSSVQSGKTIYSSINLYICPSTTPYVHFP